jgi:hypothetical protein
MTLLPILVAAVLPWVHGLTDVSSTDSATPGEPAWLTEDSLCPAEAQPPLRLTVRGQTITATYTTGIRVENAEGIEVASSPGYPCFGSADALDGLAVASIFGEPAIILTFTSGGRNEQWTWVGVYRVGFAGSIDALFAGVVEHREDGIVRTGSVRFVPGALIYRPPGARDTLWVWDPVVHTYVPRGWFGHEGEPHS